MLGELRCVRLRETAGVFESMTFPSFRSSLASLGETPEIVAMGAFGPEPVGLALGLRVEGGYCLASLFVKPEARRKGIGRRLLGELEREISAEGGTRMETSYRSGLATTSAFEAVLAKRGWTPPRVRQVYCRCSPRMLEADWARDWRPPEGYEIVPWSSVTDEDRRHLRESQAACAWYPESLSPLVHEVDCEPLNSIGLRHGGRIVGWLLTHRIDAMTIRYTCSYLDPKLQSIGRIVGLYVSAARLQTAALGPATRAVWTIPVIHPRMVAFARRRMAPHLDEFAEFRISGKPLTGDASLAP